MNRHLTFGSLLVLLSAGAFTALVRSDDAETAADVIRGLEQLATGRTVLIATHDAEVLQMSGRRFVMTRPERALTEGLPA